MIKATGDADFKAEMRRKLKENNGYCPCALEKNENTKCMCREFRDMEEGTCHCGLYTKTK